MLSAKAAAAAANVGDVAALVAEAASADAAAETAAALTSGVVPAVAVGEEAVETCLRQ